jgi:hypothetical protein
MNRDASDSALLDSVTQVSTYVFRPNPALQAALRETAKANAALALKTAEFRLANDELEAGLKRTARAPRYGDLPAQAVSFDFAVRARDRARGGGK